MWIIQDILWIGFGVFLMWLMAYNGWAMSYGMQTPPLFIFLIGLFLVVYRLLPYAMIAYEAYHRDRNPFTGKKRVH